MSFPLVPETHKQKSLVSSEKLSLYCAKKRGLKAPLRLPSRAILCFTAGLARAFKGHKNFQESVPFYKTGLHIDLYKRKNTAHTGACLVSRFGIGAPGAVVCLEKLRAGGVTKFISLGLVGALNPELKTGDKVLIKKSFRDEGCSYHYKAPSPYVSARAGHTFKTLARELKLKTVVSWTTDAPFRETKKSVLYFKSQGADCVEMESSALMAVGEYYNLSVCCIGVVSDHLSANTWTPNFFHHSIKKSLYEALNKILLSL